MMGSLSSMSEYLQWSTIRKDVCSFQLIVAIFTKAHVVNISVKSYLHEK
jgi:hypothetical protein